MVRRRAESDEVAGLVTACERRCAEDGITVVTYRTQQCRVHAPARVKEREVLKPNDAYRLYDQLHFSPVIVLAFSSAFVSREPGLSEPPAKALLSVQDFVRHKALYRLIRGAAEVGMAFEGFVSWRNGVHCDGEDDPRTLPLHMFATDCDCTSLGTDAADEAFRRRHGGPPCRRDDKGLSWQRANRNAYHGRPVLRVAGTDLAPGMHWEVASRRKRKLQNSMEVWRLEGASTSYVNVYPNAHISVSGARSTAKKIWPSKTNSSRKMPR